ncbi:hypothetical protein O1611_g4685 [Lasiodiplodia mahajangana]|uniref:Uncharacterized protein n=1 Tax=Lasiodiplodia mahajangana TaxID=1108764 RepID=A0ACC2JNA8_9PEZI|nr:hypothetical protein O1611_g4685 [Lasiodiplodia mahajangana]
MPLRNYTGPPPADGTNTRHALIFCDNVLSAFLLAMLLFTRFQNDEGVVILYAHGGLDMRTRQEYVDYIQEDCDPYNPGPVKVLVSTLDIMGQGFNLFRANTVILTEIPRSIDMTIQAFGRVDRRGQVMNVNLVQLYDSENLCEEIRRNKHDNVAQVSGERYRLAILFGATEGDDRDEEVPEPMDVDGDPMDLDDIYN